MGKRNKRWIWPVCYGVLLISFTAYTALDTFVIPRAMTPVTGTTASVRESTEEPMESASRASETEGQVGETAGQETLSQASETAGQETKAEAVSQVPSAADAGSSSSGTVAAAENFYEDDRVSVTITEYREYDSAIYAADVVLKDTSALKTAFAESTYGRNITAKTSQIAESVGAILAINGDFYGAQERGYVIRNGVIYRDTAVSGQEDLVIYGDGSFSIIREDEVTAQELLADGAVQVLSFGPALITDGEISVEPGEEVGKAMASNPRTAIAVTSEGHYLFVVSDGRTAESAGLSLSEMAAFLQSLGAETAYNLDGGGSSTMVFEGAVINHPTTGGKRSKERSVSDIVYIGV